MQLRDILKLIVSTGEADATLLRQGELPVTFAPTMRGGMPRQLSTLNRLMARVNTRDFGSAPAATRRLRTGRRWRWRARSCGRRRQRFSLEMTEPLPGALSPAPTSEGDNRPGPTLVSTGAPNTGQGVKPLDNRDMNSPGPTEARSQWSPDLILQAFKEIVTAVLGLMLVGWTVSLTQRTFTYVGDPAKISDAKDVLLLALGLAGVVVGYYFGRVPADMRATQAQQQANTASAHAEEMRSQVHNSAEQIDQMLDQMPAPASVVDRDVAAGPTHDVGAELRRLRDDLRRTAQATAQGRKGSLIREEGNTEFTGRQRLLPCSHPPLRRRARQRRGVGRLDDGGNGEDDCAAGQGSDCRLGTDPSGFGNPKGLAGGSDCSSEVFSHEDQNLSRL